MLRLHPKLAFNLEKVRRTTRGYRLRAAVFILLGMIAGTVLGRYSWWQEVSFSMYGGLVRWASDATHPQHTAAVLIDDDDYWRRDWARRVPLKRDQLAKLISTVAKASPALIAVDIDLSAQTPNGKIRSSSDYARETQVLLETVRAVSASVPIALSKTIGYDPVSDRYFADANAYEDTAFVPGRVVLGYTRLPYDLRQVALDDVLGKTNMASLAIAVARRIDRKAADTAKLRGGDSRPFCSFLTRKQFDDFVFSAGDVLGGNPVALAALKGRVVVIGADWHTDAAGRGDRIDEHLTPVGRLPGALVHANYMEAVLSERVKRPTFEIVAWAFELAVGAVLAVIFVGAAGYAKLFYLSMMAIVVALLEFVMWQNFGVFFDAVPLLLILSGHAAMEQVREWKKRSDAHENCPMGATS